MKPLATLVNHHRPSLFLLQIVLLWFLTACNKSPQPDPLPASEKSIDDLIIARSFNWATSHLVFFSIQTIDNQDNPLVNIRLSVYASSPDSGGVYLFSGVTDDSGLWTIEQEIPAYLKEVVVANNYLGLNREMKLPVTGNIVTGKFGGLAPIPINVKSSAGAIGSAAATKWIYLSTYNTIGVPNNLEPENDIVDQTLLNDLNASLPEKKPVPVNHPEYIASTVPNNLDILETCDVWITYITEGAGWMNSLGFFTFPTNSPPASAASIDTIKIIFPNLSNTGSNGGLNPGNKVYLGRFPAGRSIGWVVVPYGWNGKGTYVGNYVIYSIPSFNPEPDANLKKHMIVLRDAARLQFLYAFEDTRRDQAGVDQDFNDGVLYVKVNPVTAINTLNMPSIITTQTDTDGDGIPNDFDDYPNDASKAFDNWTPGETTYGSLAFEDLWPGKGDYDFNDLVVSYRFNQITNAQNKVVQVKATLITEAMGASLHNAFGFQMAVSPSDIAGVTGIDLRHNLITLTANNTEAEQTKAVVIAYDDAYDRLPSQGGTGANTDPGLPYVTPDTMRITINMANPIAISIMGTPPYNPFIIVDQNRNREVHLPDKPPTDKVNGLDFGTQNDDSQPASGRYYKTSTNLPWAMNIVEKFNYVIERVPVNKGFLKFNDWAESSAALFPDWFKALTGYRDPSKIYLHTK
jgi:LruC domain-containing protein